MKKMDSKVLSAWKLRQPAAELRQRIFAGRPLAPEHKSFWTLLIPAAACVLLSLMVINPASLLSPASQNRTGSAILSNLSYSAFSSGSAQNVQNHLASLSFEWTNRSLLSSPIGFTSSTN